MQVYRRCKYCHIVLRISVFLVMVSVTSAVDRLKIEDTRGENYLPYSVDRFFGGTIEGDRVAVLFNTQVYQTAHPPDQRGIYITAFNRMKSEDLPADISVWYHPDRNYLDEFPVYLFLSDFTFYRDLESGKRGFVGVGFRNDSAFAAVKVPGRGELQYIWLTSGHDLNGNGEWHGMVFCIAVTDFDYDGRDEVFLHVSPGRDATERLLICLDPNARKVRWKLPVACCLPRGCLLSCRDSLNPGIIFGGYGPGGGADDSLFSSRYGYLTRIDRSGHVVMKYIVAKFAEPANLFASPSDSFLFLFHSLPFTADSNAAAESTSATRLSKITPWGVPVASVDRPGRESLLWFSDYDNDGKPDIYVETSTGVISVFDQDLQLLAESPPTSLRSYRTTLFHWGEFGEVFLFDSPRGVEVFSHDFKKIALIGQDAGLVEPLAYHADGTLDVISASMDRSSFLARIRKRTLAEFVSVAYFDYQIYILSALFSLVIGLLTMNRFRSRLSHQRRALAEANVQLADAHEKLKQAQSAIIAQEKYRQAKDIAGAFAHEIRNALFPADSALTRMSQLRRAHDADPERLERLQDSVRTAVARAVNITDEISQYTKLDTEYSPGPVRIRTVVDDLLRAHRDVLADQGIKVIVTGPDEAVALANTAQLLRVFSNLLLNSLDALIDRPDPAVEINWVDSEEHIIIQFRDNGAGIAQEHLGRIFDAFFSTKSIHGTGIGLAVCRKTVEMYGGSIIVASESSRGTTFTITLRSAEEAV